MVVAYFLIVSLPCIKIEELKRCAKDTPRFFLVYFEIFGWVIYELRHIAIALCDGQILNKHVSS
jgi:hypothetical protein